MATPSAPPSDGAIQTRIISNADKSLVAHIISYGATITHLLVPDKAGVTQDIVLGFDKPEDYTDAASGNQYFGCTMGRTANRTAGGKLQLDGREAQLTVNNGPNHLHGGVKGWDKQHWTFAEASDTVVKLTLTSPHGDEGYPGTVNASITYEVTDDRTLRLTYWARLADDQPEGVDSTVVNMTHHSYFNLSGGAEHTILDHVLWTDADRYVAVNADLVPTGELVDVTTVPSMDFRTAPRKIGEGLHQAPGGGGYDQCMVLPEATEPLQRKAASLACPASGITVEMWTTEPGFQLYSSNFVDGTASCKASTQGKLHGSYKYEKYGGLCLEACRFPDAANHAAWRGQVVLKKGQDYRQQTKYRVLVQS